MNNIFSTQTGRAWFLLGISVWNFIWKGLSLWRSSRDKQKYWFVAILVLNTLGILEIAYLLFFQKKDPYIKTIKKHFSSK